MSRSRKKVPAYNCGCAWDAAFRKANKRSERRAVKNALRKGDWDIMPHPKELGKCWWWSGKSGIHDPEYFESVAYHKQEIYAEADRNNRYVFEEIDGHPFDSEREWRTSWGNPLDKDLSWSYTALYKDLHTWFPIQNSHPVDPNWCDQNYIKEYYKRK